LIPLSLAVACYSTASVVVIVVVEFEISCVVFESCIEIARLDGQLDAGDFARVEGKPMMIWEINHSVTNPHCFVQ